MNERTKRINKAILAAKKRDHYICQRCGAGRYYPAVVDGAHLLPRNSPQPRFFADNVEHIVTLCRTCHQAYDSNKTMSGRHRWLMEAGLKAYAELVLSFYGEGAT